MLFRSAFVILTNDFDYQVYVSELGNKVLGSNRLISEQPFLGSVFKSQNASTWVAAPGETLCLNLKVCNFAGGAATFDAQSVAGNTYNYDLMELTTRDMTFNSVDSIKYQTLTKDLNSYVPLND